MKQIRKRLTYANVMATIAVFLVLGGATAFAALGKGTVGTKQLKKNAVTTAKLKNNSVTTAKLKNGAVTGAKVNLGSLGTVPSAADANTVAGNTVRKFFYQSNATASATTILQLHGLTLTVSCPGGVPQARATTSVPGSLIHSGGDTLINEAFYEEVEEFNPGTEFDFLGSGITGSDSVEGTFTYSEQNGNVVTATFLAEQGAPNALCLVAGHAIG